MPVLTKICGVRDHAALDAAIVGGASHVGFVLASGSPRTILADQARALSAHAAGRVRTVLLLVDAPIDAADAAIQTVRPDAVQLHGFESADYVQALRGRAACELWKAVGVVSRTDLDQAAAWEGSVERVLIDARPPAGSTRAGGHGLRFDWNILNGWRAPMPWALAGGLSPTNVAEAVAQTGAPMVDVSSGVESAPGQKDVDLIAAFLKAVGSAS